MVGETPGGQPTVHPQPVTQTAVPAAVPINSAPMPAPVSAPVVDPGVLAALPTPEVPAMQQQPPGVEVVIAGQRMMVDPAIAVALDAERANALQAPPPQAPAPSLADDLGIEAPSVAPPAAPAEPVAAPVTPQEDELTELMFADPARYHQVLTEQIGKTIEADLTKKYTAQRNVDKFNDRFYAANPHLRGYEGIVNDQLVANFEGIKNLPTDQAIAVLTEKANVYVSGLVQRYTGVNVPGAGIGPADPTAPQPVPRTIAAGGTGPVTPQVPGGTPPDQGGAPAANPEVASMSDYIRARKKVTYGT